MPLKNMCCFITKGFKEQKISLIYKKSALSFVRPANSYTVHLLNSSPATPAKNIDKNSVQYIG